MPSGPPQWRCSGCHLNVARRRRPAASSILREEFVFGRAVARSACALVCVKSQRGAYTTDYEAHLPDRFLVGQRMRGRLGDLVAARVGGLAGGEGGGGGEVPPTPSPPDERLAG